MNLRGVDLTEHLRKIGIYQETDIPSYTKQLSDEIIVKSRINREMPKIIISSTPKGINHRDIADMRVLALESYYRFYDEVDTYPSLEKISECKAQRAPQDKAQNAKKK